MVDQYPYMQPGAKRAPYVYKWVFKINKTWQWPTTGIIADSAPDSAPGLSIIELHAPCFGKEYDVHLKS